MTLLAWLEEYLLPLFGSISESQLASFESLFWLIQSVVIIHALVVVPYLCILKLLNYKRLKK